MSAYLGAIRKQESIPAGVAPFVNNTSKAFVVITDMIRNHEERTARLENTLQEIQSGHQVTLVLQDDVTGLPVNVTYALVQLSPATPVYGKILKWSSTARITRNSRRESGTNLGKFPSYDYTGRHRVYLRRKPSVSASVSSYEAGARPGVISCQLAKKIARKVIEGERANRTM